MVSLNYRSADLLRLVGVVRCHDCRALILVVDWRFCDLRLLTILNVLLLITVARSLRLPAASWSEMFKIKNLVLIFVESSCNRTASSAILRIKSKHASDCLVEVLTIFVSKILEKHA